MSVSATLRGWGKTAALAAGGFVGDSPLFLADYLLRFLRVALLLSLWKMLLAGRSVGGMSLSAALTYTWLGEVLSEPLACRTELGNALWDGSIATRVLRPGPLLGQFVAEAAGRWVFGFVFFSVPLFLIAPVLEVDIRPAGPLALALFVPGLLLAMTVAISLEALYGAGLVLLEQNLWAFQRVRAALELLLSGRVIPLPLLPWGLGAWFGWLPFAAVAAAPLQIYTGVGNPWRILLAQAIWALILPLAAHLLWTRNRERLVGYGG